MKPTETIGQAFLSVCAVVVVAGLAFFLRFNLATTSSLELLLIVIVALQWGFASATVASLAGAFLLNFLFTPPLFSFSVADPKNLVSLGAFEATVLLVSRLSANIRKKTTELEVHRRRNSKLYELSRAILLIDNQRPTNEQISTLIRELIEVSSVSLWVLYESSRSGNNFVVEREAAHQAYLLGVDSDATSTHRATRILRSGTTAIGAMILDGWRNDPLLADAVASLVAVAFERTRALRTESRAEAQRNTEQLRTAILDGLAHGFKTPLTAIQTASSGLLEIHEMTATQEELVTIIDEQATVLAKLTTRLLQTAALESKEVRLRLTSESITDIIQAVLQDEARDVSSRIKISIDPDIQMVNVDAPLLRLALLQLIDNAAKYATVGPEIEVKVSQSDLETTVTVANEGPQIKTEEWERIFERFYRSNDILHGPTGTGLGLSIVKKTAEAHGGRVWVESNSASTRFSIAIPR